MRRAVLATIILACGACSLPPSQECVDYVACQDAVDPSVNVDDYRAGGSCWSAPQTASACTEQCAVALAALRETPEPPPACKPP